MKACTALLKLFFLILLLVSGGSFAEQVTTEETDLKYKADIYHHLSIPDDGSSQLTPLNVGGYNQKATYKLSHLGKEYFVKIVKSSPEKREVDLFNLLSFYSKNTGVEDRLKETRASFLFPIHQNPYVAEDGHEILVFPFIKGVTLYAIKRLDNNSQFLTTSRLNLGKKAFSLYGQALGVVQSNVLEVTENGSTIGFELTDMHWKNAMYAPDTDELFLIDAVNRLDFLTDLRITDRFRTISWDIQRLYEVEPSYGEAVLKEFTKGYTDFFRSGEDLLDYDMIYNYWLKEFNHGQAAPNIYDVIKNLEANGLSL